MVCHVCQKEVKLLMKTKKKQAVIYIMHKDMFMKTVTFN